MQTKTKSKPDWLNIVFLPTAHLLAAFGLAYLCIHFSWWTLGLGLLWGVFTGLSITGGYHRLFSHASYEASFPLRLFYLLFGAAAAQNSALKWGADHRAHHARTDKEEDPYNIGKGFWWAHMGWIFFRVSKSNVNLAQDLSANRMISLQHRFYLPLALLMGFALPAAIGTAWGDPWGALWVAGFLRMVAVWHATFSVNSLTHTFGRKPFSTATSARDSFWVALVTLGEGYHNFHHRFMTDYRNGIRWYHFDPTKWWVWTLSRFGQTRNLRRVPSDRVEQARQKVRQELRRPA